MKDLNDIGAVCDDCARNAGFIQKFKALGYWMGECEMCGERKPCTDLWHDWVKAVKQWADDLTLSVSPCA